MKWERVSRWVPVEICQVDIVDDRLIEAGQVHLLRQLGCKGGLPGTWLRQKRGKSVEGKREGKEEKGRKGREEDKESCHLLDEIERLPKIS